MTNFKYEKNIGEITIKSEIPIDQQVIDVVREERPFSTSKTFYVGKHIFSIENIRSFYHKDKKTIGDLIQALSKLPKDTPFEEGYGSLAPTNMDSAHKTSDGKYDDTATDIDGVLFNQ